MKVKNIILVGPSCDYLYNLLFQSLLDQPAMTMSLVFSPHLFASPTSTATYSLLSCWTATSHPPPSVASPPTSRSRRWSHARCSVVADQALLLGEEDEKSDVAEFDWREEWYPLYLAKDVPDDAPVGLTVYDQQLVLYRDGAGELRCYQDRCPHRLAKLSEGQLIDGRLECLYHGWQFEGDGRCVKIPQLPSEAKIPKSACLKPYEVRDSQGVVWVWMSQSASPDPKKLPWFENFARPGFQDTSTIHEVPYDHSILLENLMDPAHVPISHDRTDFYSKREDAQPLLFHVAERSGRGFAGRWGKATDRATEDDPLPNLLRFSAPCSLQNDRETVDEKTGERHYFTGLFLCRPSGQGRSMLILRFGGTKRSPLVNLFPKWFFHQNACKVLEQDMGFLSSQNEVLIRENSPTGRLYINLGSSDAWVVEYRKWVDKVGHGMPHHFGHRTASPPGTPAVVEHAPAGFPASAAAGFPAKGGVGTAVAGNPMNRYFRHVVHCRACGAVVKGFRAWKDRLSAAAVVLAAVAVLVAGRQWKAVLLVAAAACCGGAYVCNSAVDLNTVNFIRPHRRL